MTWGGGAGVQINTRSNWLPSADDLPALAALILAYLAAAVPSLQLTVVEWLDR